MKILFVSDSHGNLDILKELYRIYPNMDLYLHAGDSESYDIDTLEPFVSVKGNCDHNHELLEEIYLDSPAGKIKMSHYPYLKSNDYQEIKIFLHGHTHIYQMENMDGILYLCPGSLSYSRKGEESYMILDIDKNVHVYRYAAFTHQLLEEKRFNLD